MTTPKIVVDPTAQPIVSRLVANIQQLQVLVAQVATTSSPLIEPAFWDGVGAAEFRAVWPAHMNTVKTTLAQLLAEAQEAQKNIQAIDTADAANQVR